ncbi:hypothetical protein RI129_005500 [Pyrocoelia pectoralis]|uniref:FP protein C-terminal domain-containing protein n=1 Tax=Pyrocoelia pectoralis TaxID=417401 RepID=A0AAN7VHK6_9COLE
MSNSQVNKNQTSKTEEKQVITVSVMENLLAKLETRLLESQKRLEFDLNKSLNSAHEKLDENFKLLQEHTAQITKANLDIESLKSENLLLSKKLAENHSRLVHCEQYSRSNTLEIYGIPETKNENSLQVVLAVAEALGVTINESSIDACHRLKKVQNRPTTGIIVKFVRRYDKQLFLEKRKVKGSNFTTASLSILGLDPTNPTPVYVNQSLCKTRRVLLGKARKKAYEGNYKYVWVDDRGNIKVRKADNSKIIYVGDEVDLDSIK